MHQLPGESIGRAQADVHTRSRVSESCFAAELVQVRTNCTQNRDQNERVKIALTYTLSTATCHLHGVQVLPLQAAERSTNKTKTASNKTIRLLSDSVKKPSQQSYAQRKQVARISHRHTMRSVIAIWEQPRRHVVNNFNSNHFRSCTTRTTSSLSCDTPLYVYFTQMTHPMSQFGVL